MKKAYFELTDMCSDLNFDTNRATELIKEVNINQVIDTHKIGDAYYPTTLLEAAILNFNISMVKLLLANGANPNFIDDLNRVDPVLWNLQYPSDSNTEKDNNTQLKITQLLLENDASPLIESERECLFNYVCFATFNDDYDYIWEYRSRFFILLIAYGGKSEYCTPVILKPFDMKSLDQYRFYLVPCDDGYHLTGKVVDKNDTTIATVY